MGLFNRGTRTTSMRCARNQRHRELLTDCVRGCSQETPPPSPRRMPGSRPIAWRVLKRSRHPGSGVPPGPRGERGFPDLKHLAYDPIERRLSGTLEASGPASALIFPLSAPIGPLPNRRTIAPILVSFKSAGLRTVRTGPRGQCPLSEHGMARFSPAVLGVPALRDPHRARASGFPLHHQRAGSCADRHRRRS